MIPDFSETFQSYSDFELAAIVQNPSAYQPEAVEAAFQLLMQRGVGAAEIEAIAKAGQLKEQKKKATDETTLAPVIPLKTELPEWGYFFFLIVFIVMGLMWFRNFMQLLKGLENKYYRHDYTPVMFILLVAIPVMMVLLVMKRKAGWVMGVSISLFSALAVFISIILSGGIPKEEGLGTNVILSLLAHSVILLLLYRRRIRDAFGVRSQLSEKALLGGLALTILFFFTT